MVNELPLVFSALSDPTRLQAVTSLRKHELSAGELAQVCNASPPAMSRHLRVLRKAGIIEVTPADRTQDDARLRVYRLRPEVFFSVAEWAAHMRAFWRDQLYEFKHYAERESFPPVKRKKRGRK